MVFIRPCRNKSRRTKKQSADVWRCTGTERQESITSHTSACTTPLYVSEEGNSSFESQLRQKDEVIASLCKTMRATEKIMQASEEAQSKRTAMLELQIEQLVEASSSAERARLGGAKAKATPSFTAIPSSGDDNDHVHALNELLGQVSSLKELLARVLAEKDKLKAENNNLKQVFKKEKGDKMSNKKKSRRKAMDDSLLDVYDGCHNMSISVNDLHDLDVSELELDEVTTHGRTPPIHYLLSCGSCRNNHSHIKYSGSYTPKSTNFARELPDVLVAHYSQVWKMMHDADNFLSSSVHLEEFMGKVNATGGFPSSSFARHLVKHCKDCDNEAEVVNWCVKNVRVEVARTLRTLESFPEEN